MCNLNQDSGVGKALNKAHQNVNKVSLGAKFADKGKRKIHGDEYVDAGGHRAMLYKDGEIKSKEQQTYDEVMAGAPTVATNTPEYADWYRRNKTILEQNQNF